MDARLTRRRFLGAAAAGATAVALLPRAALARYVDPGPLQIDLRGFGVVADGRTDDGPALARAFASAPRGDLTLLVPGTLLVGAPVIVPDGVSLDLGSSTVLKAAGLNAPALLVRGNGVAIGRLVVDGNRRGGAHGPGVEWQGTGGRLFDATIRNTDVAGVVARVVGADVECTRVACLDHVSGVKSGDGFYAALGGKLRLGYGCSGSGNDRAGVYLESSAAPGCAVNGSFDRNGVVGTYLKSPAGTSDSLSLNANERFGLIMKQAATGWRFGTVSVQGGGAGTSVTGIELYGSTGNSFRSIVVRGVTGYGLALAGGDLGGPGASGNTFTSIDCDATGAPDSDPAVLLAGGAKRNAFGRLVVRAHTAALSFGEGYLSLDNDGNTFALVRAQACAYSVLVLRGGSGNRFDRIESVGCGTVDPAIAQGLIVFGATATQDNTVGYLDVTADPTGRLAPPLYLVVAEGAARNNRVLAGRRGPSRLGVELDASGANPVALS